MRSRAQQMANAESSPDGASAGGQWSNSGRDIDEEELRLGMHCGATAETDEANDTGDAAGGRGEFLHATYRNEHGEREYRLYRPVGYAESDRAMPLVLMLHGCAHTPENFAVGTRMNMLADRLGFLVAYPRQTMGENRAKCWNWYRPDHQKPDEGEPSILAGITHEIASTHRVDTGRIFVAGLSAGASMAAILGHTYPTLFRAICVHSGTPYLSAHSAPSALATLTGHGYHKSEARQTVSGLPVPMILFQGDRDRVVDPVNADALVRQAAGGDLVATTETGRVPDGHAYTREVFTDGTGQARIERWTVHGSGHAWSGGSAEGAYTDPEGPDASAAMLEFFMRVSEQPATHAVLH
ncbi:alpha/beta hydrolase family esterase [Lysobacter korlensis]|uniref:Alpha/beta hydrolase family esterase n=1 Tax=Lysobacter korlensis TaxID=553636 RepID=A0ABV6RQW4_9GAMM